MTTIDSRVPPQANNKAYASRDEIDVQASVQQQALRHRLDRRIAADGKFSLPAVPGMLDDYAERCRQVFAALGRAFSETEMEHLRKVLAQQLAAAFEKSQRSSITLSYKADIAGALNYSVTAHAATLEETYDTWVATRQPPYFGTHADARVLALAQQAANPAALKVLDIGAGTGRNALALARRGHPVDALEMNAKFAGIIQAEAQQAALPVRVIRRDVLDGTEGLASDYGLILVSEVITDFRTVAQLRHLLEVASARLQPGGQLVFNLFLVREGYGVDEAARQFGQQVYCCLFTRTELAGATAGLPLELVDDVSVVDYEKAHLPAENWPPTGWYVDWVSGRDVFDSPPAECPIELRWVVMRGIPSPGSL